MLVSSFSVFDSRAFKLTRGAYAATRTNSMGDRMKPNITGCYSGLLCRNSFANASS